MKRLSVLAVLACQISFLKAQVPIDHVSLYDQNGNGLRQIWTGGIMAPMIGKLDVDADGKKDLLLYMQITGRTAVYLNKNTEEVLNYEYSWEASQKIPSLKNWVRVVDYDKDGYEDLFTAASGGGIRVFRNSSSKDKGLQFTEVSGKLMTDDQDVVFASAEDVPAIHDIDNDGDLDILVMQPSGVSVIQYTNLSVETNGSSNGLVFNRSNECYGKFVKDICDPEIKIELGEDCMEEESKPLKRGFAGGLEALDYNGDGLTDLLLTDIYYKTITLLVNGGTIEEAEMTAVEYNFPAEQGVFDIGYDPIANVLDIDDDGDMDVVISSSDLEVEGTSSIRYYENTSMEESMSLELQQTDFLSEGHWGNGTWNQVVTADINGDQLQDMVVGYMGVSKGFGQIGKGRIEVYLKQVGEQVGYHLSDIELLDEGDLPTGKFSLSFGDVDKDGDQDFVMGKEDGTISYYENKSQEGSVVFEESSETFAMIDESGGIYPQLFDLNKDENLDLIYGTFGHNGLVYYENNGDNWTKVTEELGGVHLPEADGKFELTPCFFRNGEGSTSLYVGNRSGNILQYSGIDDNLNQAFYPETSQWHNVNFGRNASLTLAHLDDDDKVEVLVATYDGGYHLFEMNEPNGADEYRNTRFRVFPNPVSGNMVTLNLGALEVADLTLGLYDIQGRELVRYDQILKKEQLQLILPEDLQTGMYILRIGDQGQVVINRR